MKWSETRAFFPQFQIKVLESYSSTLKIRLGHFDFPVHSLCHPQHWTKNLKMNNYPQYNQGNHSQPRNQSQVPGAHGPQDHTHFFLGHYQHRQAVAQLDDPAAHQPGQAQQPQQDHPNHYHFTYTPNSTYQSLQPSSLTTLGQQSQDYHYNYQQPQVSQAHTNPISAPNHQPHQHNPRGNRVEIHPPTTTQRRHTGRHRREEPVSVSQLPPTIESTSLTTPKSSQTQGPTNTRAIVNLFLPNSLRGERGRSPKSLSNLPSPEDMMKKSSVELRMLANKHAKKKSSLPVAMHSFFMELYDEFDKALAINCINNQVSVDSVHKLWYVQAFYQILYQYTDLTTGVKRAYAEVQTASKGGSKPTRSVQYSKGVSFVARSNLTCMVN